MIDLDSHILILGEESDDEARIVQRIKKTVAAEVKFLSVVGLSNVAFPPSIFDVVLSHTARSYVSNGQQCTSLFCSK